MMTNRHLWACPHSFRGCTFPGLFPFPWNPCCADREGWAKYERIAETMKPMMKKPAGDKPPEGPVSKWVDGDFEKEWPFLSAFLAQTQWDDGTIRETGTLLLFVQEGYLKCCLNDRAMDRSAFVTGASINCLFDLCEAGLEKGDLDWRKRRKA